MRDGSVEVRTYVRAEVYDLAETDGPRGRGEANAIAVELHHDDEGVIVKIGANRYLVPTAVIDAARKIRK